MVSQTPPDDPTPAPDSSVPTAGDSWTARHPVVTYTLARVVLFVVPFAVFYFLADLLSAVLLAFVVSAIASIFLLRNQRAALSTSIATRAERANQKMAERAAAEDDWDDVQRGDAEGSDSRTD
jgi:uncharacterized membrane protein